MRVLITGASGYIGSRLAAKLVEDQSISVRLLTRRDDPRLSEKTERIVVEDLMSRGVAMAMEEVDVVIHLAGIAHVTRNHRSRSLPEQLQRVNVDGTLNVAKQAIAAGVRRLIFLSSVKVNGECTQPGRPYKADDPVSPGDFYGVSKARAEAGLQRLADAGRLDLVVIRSPLVYGPNVGANFLTMMHWLYRCIPLPFGAVDNRRSLIALDNLVNVITRCMVHPAAANRTFLVSDAMDLSTAELLRRLGDHLGRPARLISVSPALLRTVAMAMGRGHLADRLVGSLQVDVSEARRILEWNPPLSVDEGLKAAAHWFVSKTASYNRQRAKEATNT